jgi:hypothetical protein
MHAARAVSLLGVLCDVDKRRGNNAMPTRPQHDRPSYVPAATLSLRRSDVKARCVTPLAQLDDLVERQPVGALDPLLGRAPRRVGGAGRVAEGEDDRDALVLAVAQNLR